MWAMSSYEKVTIVDLFTERKVPTQNITYTGVSTPRPSALELFGPTEWAIWNEKNPVRKISEAMVQFASSRPSIWPTLLLKLDQLDVSIVIVQMKEQSVQ